jgi:sRNA-binding carbon storage regulator CsrA
MLIIKRKSDEAITIAPKDGLDLSQTVEQLFAAGPIEIWLEVVGNNRVNVAIDAPRQLMIWRGLRRIKTSDDLEMTDGQDELDPALAQSSI